MNNWPTKKLGEVCEKIKIEKAPVGANPYVEIGDVNIETKNINFKKKGAVKGSIFAPPNCIIVSRVRPTRGAAVLLEDQTIISSAFTILKPKPIIDLRFLFLCTAKNPKFFNYLGTKQKGSNYPSCKEADILDFEIPLPPLEVQKKIVTKVESLLAKVSEAKKLRAEAQENADNLLSAELHKIFEEGKSKDWRETTLGAVLDLCDSGTWGEESSDGLPLLRSTNMQNGNLILDDLKTIAVPKDKINRYLLREGDILITKSSGSVNHIGKSLYITKEMHEKYGFSNFTQRLRINKEQALPKWIYIKISDQGTRDFLLNASQTTTGLRNLKILALKELKILLPPLTEQKKIVAHLDSISQKVQEVKELQNTTQKELDVLERSILSKAFSGELI